MVKKIRSVETEDARLYDVGYCDSEMYNDFLKFLDEQKAKGHTYLPIEVGGSGLRVTLIFNFDKTPVNWRMPNCEIKIREEI